MSNSYYPEIEPGALLPVSLLFQNLLNDPLWLERPACPYETEVKEAIRDLWIMVRQRPSTNVASATSAAISDGESQWSDVAVELRTLFNDLKTFSASGVDIDSGASGLDPKEQMAYFRTATSLLDKIVSLGERANNIKAVSEFQSSVIKCFDEVLSPEQRTRMMEILGQ